MLTRLRIRHGRSLERQSIPAQIADICRYQTQTTNELTKAIDRLMSLQAARKESVSI